MTLSEPDREPADLRDRHGWRQIAEALADVGRAAAQSLDPAKVAHQVAESLCSILAAASAAVYRVRRDDGALVALAVARSPGATVEWDALVAPGTDVVGAAARARTVIVTPDAPADPRLSFRAERRRGPAQSERRAFLAVPLLIRGGVIGALAVSDRAGRIFDAHAVAVAEGFAAQLAVALDHAELSGRRLREARLRQSQRMETVGKLAGGVAHDFNNLLTIIQGRAEIVRSKLGVTHPLRRDVELIHTAAERGAMLTQQLLAFSRRQVLQPRVLDLAAVVDGMASMLRRLIGEDIDLRVEHRGRGALVEADPGQLEQLIMNLAVNARDAMPNGGRLTIATAAGELDRSATTQHPELAPGPYVSLSVSDTGCGMDAEVRTHLFEPFFTTKERGKGAGLGLSTVYGIVQQHGGSIAVESEVGRGSAFVVLLPQVTGPSSEPGASADAGEPPRGMETILLVEDEDQVRAFARETLEAAGYTVLEAAGPGRALRLAGEHPGAIHVLLTDLVMPEMSGRELAERLAGLRPGLRVAYMSGYTDDAIVAHGVRDRDASFLQKPFDRGSLTRLVREALDRPPGNALAW
jgi:signal transduction histidine kinase/CheY-like chemotaxis protein